MQREDIYVAPLLFPWPRSGLPTFFILESPLDRTLLSSFCNDSNLPISNFLKIGDQFFK